MPMQPCCVLSYNEDKPSTVLTASPRMQDHHKREGSRYSAWDALERVHTGSIWYKASTKLRKLIG